MHLEKGSEKRDEIVSFYRAADGGKQTLGRLVAFLAKKEVAA